MKLSIVSLIAAAAMAGSAFAQSDHGTSGGATGIDPSYMPLSTPISGKSLREHYAANQKMRISCATERETLCRGKHDGAANRCIAYHKLEISHVCRVDMEKAWQGRL